MKIYYIYQITNLVNNKIYVGVHETLNLDDGYMGSGKVIKDAIKKYGIDNFVKDILEFFENAEDMYAREKEIVTDEFLLREDVYNLRRGGTGGFDYINKTGLALSGHHKSYDVRVKVLEKNRENILKSGHHIKNYSMPGFKSKNNQKLMLELSRTEQSREKRKSTMRINKHSQGSNNSQFNTIWITDGIHSTKIGKDDIIPDGYRRGRVINK